MLVLDTDVIVAALRSPSGASAELLDQVLDRRQSVAISTALLLEYESVSLRSEHLSAAGLDESHVVAILDALIAVAYPVTPHFRWRPQLRDPSDELVLEAAVNASASAIITFNHRHFRDAAGKFGLEILRPSEILERNR